MRERSTTTGDFDQEANLTYVNLDTSASNPDYLPTMYGERTVKTIKDIELPGFHALQKCRAGLPYNPVLIETRTETRTPGNWDHTSTAPNAHVYGTRYWHSEFNLTPPSVSEAELQDSVNGAVAKARAATMDALTFLAEFKQTQEMFLHTVDRVSHFGFLAAQKARKAARRPSDVIPMFSRYWLEYRYGWSPVIFDIQDSVEAILKLLKDQKFLEGHTGVVYEDSFSESRVGSTYPWREDYFETLTFKVGVRGFALMEITGKSEFGFDPIKTAWELLTFSFVIDWLIDIGTWIDTWSPFSVGGLVTSGVSLKEELHWRLETDIQFTQSGFTGGFTTKPLRELHVKRYQRFAVPPGLPGWNPRISPTRLIDAVALVVACKAKIFGRLYKI